MWESVKQYVKENLSRMRREPGGILRYPYIVPGSDTYATTLWDWDSWWTCIAIGQADAEEGTAKNSLPYEQGCILNFLDHMDEQGKMPILITNDNFLPDNEMDYIGKNNHKPVLAQHALYTAQIAVTVVTVVIVLAFACSIALPIVLGRKRKNEGDSAR